MVNLCCILTTEPLEWLTEMLRTAFMGSRIPDALYLVLNRPRRSADLGPLLDYIQSPSTTLIAGDGSEAFAMNYFMHHVPETRILMHPDAAFGKYSIDCMLEAPGDFRIDDSMGCVVYTDACRQVGDWDEAMSPGFYRYVDVDYEDRLAKAGIHPTIVAAGITHHVNGSLRIATVQNCYTESEQREDLARRNYEAKWGRPVTPGGNTIGRAAWRQEHPNDF